MSSRCLTVGISAEFDPENCGGIASVLLGLLHALARLPEGDERYTVIVPTPYRRTYQHLSSASLSLISRDPPKSARPIDSAVSAFRRATGPAVRVARRLVARLEQPRSPWPWVPISDGFYESLNCDVLHFPHQWFTLTAVPTIYNPHDLQHRHIPEYFSAAQIAWKETVYSFGCRSAAAVPVASGWVKNDVVTAYGIDPDKVIPIPWAPPTEAYAAPSAADLARIRREYSLPDRFALYPAVTWPHKNHSRLIDAVALLRDTRHLTAHVVCTGSHAQPEYERLKSQIREQRLEDRVLMVGRVPGEDLRGIFAMARCCIVPTLFEAASAPVFEAWEAGAPVACSAVTSLPAQAGDAALLFDPTATEAIADALEKLLTCDETCARLRDRGRRRLETFSWERTATAYRALYRRVGRRRLSEAESQLLAWNWMENAEPPHQRK